MKSITATKSKAGEQAPDGADVIAHYAKTQTPEHATICRALRAELDAVLPQAASKIWHGSPVWFIGENPVAGYNVTSKKGVNLLFWNGQSFGEPALKAAGRFRAAQIQFTDVSEIDPKALRRWLKRASTDIWDSRSHFLAQKALQKKAKPPGKLRDGAQCKVIGGVHAGQSGVIRDIKTGKTGYVSITVVQSNGERFKTLAENAVIQPETA